LSIFQLFYWNFWWKMEAPSEESGAWCMVVHAWWCIVVVVVVCQHFSVY